MSAAPIYLDSNAIIRFVEEEEEDMTSFFLWTSTTSRRVMTSELTLAEVLVIPIRDGDTALARGYEDLLQGDELLTVLPIDRPVLKRSAELRAALGGKGPDAIHCATAELAGCGLIVSSDKRLRTPDTLRRVPIEDAARLRFET